MRKRVLLLMLLMMMAGINAAQDWKTMKDSLENAVERLAYHPDSIDLRLRKASWNMRLEQWEYAKDEYDYVLSREPMNLSALFFRAYVNEKLHRYHFARLDYQNLLTVVPTNFEGRLGLALLNQKDKHYTEAMDQMHILIEQHPDSAVAYAALAGMEKERELYELAIYDYSKAIALDPSNTDYLLNRADLYIKLKKPTDARNDLERLVTLGVPKQSLEEMFDKVIKKRQKHSRKQ
ncbi:MAG: tetratricopeptide repeat protein [Prevotella sp.]|nr:tetratricopeptide repeat protein [Prevotella sp.]